MKILRQDRPVQFIELLHPHASLLFRLLRVLRRPRLLPLPPRYHELNTRTPPYLDCHLYRYRKTRTVGLLSTGITRQRSIFSYRCRLSSALR